MCVVLHRLCSVLKCTWVSHDSLETKGGLVALVASIKSGIPAVRPSSALRFAVHLFREPGVYLLMERTKSCATECGDT